ncbi:hypothetical protein NLJ89_g6561 [Agrocybe chaxingu]|uniref:Uncharacterized protein n=1 Tax=Agrocybe chaxingu TaxID=84603 RepID=A0A9W8MVW4_9AGAR|nr:hypothetical protein NLJ89_g6561 [Agrocybe chaxingu]
MAAGTVSWYCGPYTKVCDAQVFLRLEESPIALLHWLNWFACPSSWFEQLSRVIRELKHRSTVPRSQSTPQHSGKCTTGQREAHAFSTTGRIYSLMNTLNKMHISPPTTPSKDSSSGGASPPPPYAVGHTDEPIVPNVGLDPAAVTDGVFLPSSVHRAPAESQDSDIDAGSATTYSIPAPYIALSPMRPTPPSPTRNAMTSLHLGAVAARLACIEAAFRRSTRALVAPTSPTAGPAASRLDTPLRTSAISPAAGPSTTRPQSISAPPQTQGLNSSAIRASQVPAPFAKTPGQPENPIYVFSQDEASNGTSAPAQQNDGAACSCQAATEYATVAVQTDPVYILSCFLTPEPLPFWATNSIHSGTPDTNSSLGTPTSIRRSREQFERDGEPEPERPSLRRQIEEILSSMESPPPSPPGPSLARTRIRPKGKRLSYRIERPDEFGPAYRVKVLDSSDEEYKSWPSYPQAPSSNVNATRSDPALHSHTRSASSSIAPSTPEAPTSGQGTTLSILGPSTTHIDDSDGVDSDDYPDLFDFNNAAVNTQVNQALEDAEKNAEQQQIDGKGKAVAR